LRGERGAKFYLFRAFPTTTLGYYYYLFPHIQYAMFFNFSILAPIHPQNMKN
jgi:hypothetical protein